MGSCTKSKQTAKCKPVCLHMQTKILMLNHPQYHTVPSTTHKYPESINIHQNFYVESTFIYIYTYIGLTASLLDPHDIHHEGKNALCT